MRAPLWLKTRTQIATDETVNDLARVRAQLAERIRDLEIAVSRAAQERKWRDVE